MRERAPRSTPEDDPLQEKVDEELDDRGIDRRHFLKILGLSGAAVAAGGIAKKIEFLAETPPDLEKVLNTRTYDTGPLAGRNFTNLFTDYTGIHGRVPEQAEINFSKQLRHMFDKKTEFVDGREQQGHAVNRVYQSGAASLVSEYESKDPGLTDLESYTAQIRQTIEKTFAQLNWAQVGKHLGMKEPQIELLRQIASSIGSRDLLAISFTELMPSKDGRLNQQVMDFLLQNAGERYLYSVPSMSDDLTSFGPYQFTSYAVYDKHSERRGASILNLALPTAEQLPHSISELRGNDHHKAAYLFALTNIGELLKTLNTAEMAVFREKWQGHMNGVSKFTATAHHLPASAISSARRWIDKGMDAPYEDSCHEDLRDYALHTEENLNSLNE